MHNLGLGPPFIQKMKMHKLPIKKRNGMNCSTAKPFPQLRIFDDHKNSLSFILSNLSATMLHHSRKQSNNFI